MAIGHHASGDAVADGPELTIAEIISELGLAEGPSYPALLRRMRSLDPEVTAVEFEDEVITRAELLRRVAGAASWLEAQGVGRGTHVAYMFLGHPQALVSQLAVHLVGGVLAPIYPEFNGPVLAGILERLDIQFMIVHHERLDVVREAIGGLPNITVIQGTDSEYERAALRGADIDPYLARDFPGTEDDALIMSTSGTTGEPKGVVLRQSFAAAGYVNARKLQISMPVKDYLTSSWGHGGPLVQSSMSFWSGGSVVIARRFSASRFWDDIRRYGCTHFNLFGTMPQMLLAQPRRDSDRDHPVDDATVAGMPPAVWEEFTTRFGVRVSVPFSAIDAGGAYIGNPGKYPIGSCGRPWVDFDARLVDDDGHEVPTGEAGELLMRPKVGHAAVRYYNDPEASAEKTRGGWVRFGDLLRRDEDGNYWFVDRKRDVIRRRGIIIAPAQIESALIQLTGIEEVSAFAVPSDLGEDEVKIAVVPKPGSDLDPKSVFSSAEQVLPKHMRPRYIEVVEALPKTPTKRVRRVELKAAWRNSSTWDSVEGAYLAEAVS